MTTYPLILSENRGFQLKCKILRSRLQHVTCYKNKTYIVPHKTLIEMYTYKEGDSKLKKISSFKGT